MRLPSANIYLKRDTIALGLFQKETTAGDNFVGLRRLKRTKPKDIKMDFPPALNLKEKEGIMTKFDLSAAYQKLF